jgi:hypothetical protein
MACCCCRQVDGQDYGACAEASSPSCNPHARDFTERAMGLLRQYGGWRFVENLVEIGDRWPANATGAAVLLANQIRFLTSPAAVVRISQASTCLFALMTFCDTIDVCDHHSLLLILLTHTSFCMWNRPRHTLSMCTVMHQTRWNTR